MVKRGRTTILLVLLFGDLLVASLLLNTSRRNGETWQAVDGAGHVCWLT